jgi:heavy metal translocating P-type ATPase
MAMIETAAEIPVRENIFSPCCHDSSDFSHSGEKNKTDYSWLKIGMAIVLAGQGMVFGLGINTADPAPEYASKTYFVLHGSLILSALVVFFLLGTGLPREAWKAIKGKQVNVDALFLLSITGAFIGSLISTFTGQGGVYYEVVAILLVVYTFGKLLSARSRSGAIQAVEQLRDDFDWAWEIDRDQQRHRTRVADLCLTSSLVSVNEGEPITVDGIIQNGTGFVTETPLTGEPTPVVRRSGDYVLAGTHSVDGRFTIKPKALLGSRKLDLILSAVEDARIKSSRIQAKADWLMRWFLPLVVSLSAATFIVWLLLPSTAWWEALFNSMAVLLVACPCAIGLATPIALWGGLMKLAENGLVSRTGDFIDHLAKTDLIYFDKTGTLSEDHLTLVDFISTDRFKSQRNWLKLMVQTIENELSHPVAKAFQHSVILGSETKFKVTKLKIVAGGGVHAMLLDNEEIVHECTVGELSIMPEVTQSVFNEKLLEITRNAKKYVFVTVNEEAAAIAVLDEQLRPSTEEVIEDLHALGLETHILTGDSSPKWENIAGVKIESGLTPQEKTERIERSLAQNRNILYVGDGINDAAAMMMCPASVAMGSGAALTQSSATAVLMGDDLSLLPRSIKLCRGVCGSIRGNLLFAASYNLIGVSLAALGLLHPVVAVLLMVSSSFIVSFRAMRIVESGA